MAASFDHQRAQPEQAPANLFSFHDRQDRDELFIPAQVSLEDANARPNTAPETVNQLGFHQPDPRHGHHSMSPTLSQGSTAIESAWPTPSMVDDREKEVVHDYHYAPEVAMKVGSPWSLHGQAHVHEPAPPAQEQKLICGIRANQFWFRMLALLILLIVTGVALGVGLGLGLGKDHQDSIQYNGDPRYAIGGLLNPNYFSTSGVFNGSGIAFAGNALSTSFTGLYTVFYQHYKGDIRSIQLSPLDGQFEGGTSSEIVASNAKNATPISVVQYVMNNVTEWHIFFIGDDNYVKERVYKNDSAIWFVTKAIDDSTAADVLIDCRQDGPATSQNLKVYEADLVGLQACWYGNFYGDPNFGGFNTVSETENVEELAKFGMNLWYPRDESTFEQYGIYESQTEWKHQHTWSGFNTNAGVGCYSWQPNGTTTYAMMVNRFQAVEVWWRDTNQTLTSTDAHPINAWVNTTNITIGGVYPVTPLGFTDNLYAVHEDSTIYGYTIDFLAENSTILQEFTIRDADGDVKFLNGTKMTVSAIDTPSGGRQLVVFAQTEGNDLSLFTRDEGGGPWTSLKLPVDKD